MYFHEVFEGKYIFLRSVGEKDAEFIIRIRTDDKVNRYVHMIDNDVKKEIEWICEQRKREGDYFFSVIRKRDGQIVGNISVYNIKNGAGELGRWVSYGNAIENLEAAVLAHDFAFNILQVSNVYTRTMSDNKKTVSFWKRFGGVPKENVIVEDFTVYHNIVYKEQYKNEIRPKLIKILGE